LVAVSYGLLVIGWIVWWVTNVSYGAFSVTSLVAVSLASAVVVAATWWRARSPTLAPLPSALGLATAAPLAMAPMVRIVAIEPPSTVTGEAITTAMANQMVLGHASTVTVWLGLLVVTVAVAPLGWDLTMRIPTSPVRRTARLVLAGCLIGSPIAAFLASRSAMMWQEGIDPTLVWWALTLIGMMTVSLGAALATVQSTSEPRWSTKREAIGYVGIGLLVSASCLALVGGWWPALAIPAFAIMTSVALWFALQPLEAEVAEARTERDLVVVTLEAERRRVASAIHDGPLGDLALLTLRLDAIGEDDSAAIARSVAAELRALGNDLRVSILDDLGAGPAIEWLAERISEQAQVPIETDLRPVEGRPPALVELAVYRIAHEAILNATRYGRSPIRVRYEAHPQVASLDITDAGPGIPPTAREKSLREGHLGLALMAWRAEGIGARLEIAPLESGGTRVALRWAAM
jgi:signal transduction histidine kinase